MAFKILSLFPSSPAVVADSAAVVVFLNHMTDSVIDFERAVADWNGGVFGAVPLLTKSAYITKEVNDGTTMLKNATTVDPDDVNKVVAIANDIIKHIGDTVDTVIAGKSKFDNVPIIGGPILLGILHRMWDAVGSFLAAMNVFTPPELHDFADALAKEVDGHFLRAIAVFDPKTDQPEECAAT